MNIAWFTFILFTVVLPPAVVFIVAFDYFRHTVLRDELSRAKLISLSVLGSAFLHFMWVVITHHCPFLRPVDLQFIYDLANSSISGHGEFTRAVVEPWPFVFAYFASICLVALLIGLYLGWWVARRAPLGDELESYALDGTGGTWCLVDVFVESNVLYRGLFHSRGENVNGVRTINLSLVSKISRNGAPSSVSPQTEIQKEDGLKSPDVPIVKFAPIRSRAGFEELTSVVWSYLANWEMDEEARKTLFKEIFESSQNFSDFLEEVLDISPQLIIPWGRVRNLNFRPFSIVGDDMKTHETKLDSGEVL